jgi:hypothetical protein
MENNIVECVFLQPNIKNKLARAFKNAKEGSLSDFLENLNNKNLKIIAEDNDKIIEEELIEQKLFKVYTPYWSLRNNLFILQIL